MKARPKALLIGILVGATVGAILALTASPDEEQGEDGETGLAALGPGEYIQLGVAILALTRQFGTMLKRV